MTCKDCLHYDACYSIFSYFGVWLKIDHMKDNGAEKECKQFQDKSRFVELPFRAGQTIYVIGNSIDTGDLAIFEENDYSFKVYDGCGEVFVEALHVADGEFGFDVFLTYEEAEKKLEEMKNA